MVKTPHSTLQARGSIPGQGTKPSYACGAAKKRFLKSRLFLDIQISAIAQKLCHHRHINLCHSVTLLSVVYE